MPLASAAGCIESIAASDDLAEIDGLDVEPHLAGDRARHVEQIVDQLRLRLRVALDGLDRAALLILADLSGDEHARPAVDRGQRRAQLVRHGHEELVLHPVGELLAAQQLGALLEVGAQLELPPPPAQRDRHGADQDQPPHRTLEDRDVAQRPSTFSGRSLDEVNWPPASTMTAMSDHGGC